MGLFLDEFKELFETLNKDILETGSKYNNFLGALTEEDDWSYVIKSHALIETVISELLINYTGKTAFEKHFKKMGFTNKVNLLTDIELCTKQQKRFLLYYGSLRNKIVHNLDGLSFSFDKYFSEMNSSEEKNLIDSMKLSDESLEKSFIFDHPKYALWLLITSLLLAFYVNGKKYSEMEDMKETMLKNQEKLLKEFIPEIFASTEKIIEMFDNIKVGDEESST